MPQGGTLDQSLRALAWELSEALLASRSATGTLQAWCARRGIGAGPVLAIRRAQGPAAAAGDEVLEALRPARGETLWHRRVTLHRGGVALSEAENWFLPARLPPAVQAALETTDTPFGVAIAPLSPRRRTVLAALAPAGAAHVLEHRAVVVAEGRPLAVVRELYQPALLAPPLRW